MVTLWVAHLPYQVGWVSSNLAHRSIYQKHIGYFTNGYSPIYFTKKALILLSSGIPIVPLFL